MCDGSKSKSACRCGCEVRGLIQPRLLLLLRKKARHGYEMMEELRSIPGSESMADPGLLYRTLRSLEELGAVRSTWDTTGRGPARRVYELTDIGHDQLESWAADVRASRSQLDKFLTEYNALATLPTKTAKPAVHRTTTTKTKRRV
jgi:PadR family transcriptional regulator, regulatory protein PadR